MVSRDKLDFLNLCFLVEREGFSQSLQLSVNQTIDSPGTSEESLEVVCNERFEVFLFCDKEEYLPSVFMLPEFITTFAPLN